MERTPFIIVMRGLDPRIHAVGRTDVDGRVQPGHDECRTKAVRQ